MALDSTDVVVGARLGEVNNHLICTVKLHRPVWSTCFVVRGVNLHHIVCWCSRNVLESCKITKISTGLRSMVKSLLLLALLKRPKYVWIEAYWLTKGITNMELVLSGPVSEVCWSLVRWIIPSQCASHLVLHSWSAQHCGEYHCEHYGYHLERPHGLHQQLVMYFDESVSCFCTHHEFQ